MKRPIQLKDCKVILDVAHIIGVFERNGIDPINRNVSFDIEIMLEYNGQISTQILTYDSEDSRQYEMNRLVLALSEEE